MQHYSLLTLNVLVLCCLIYDATASDQFCISTLNQFQNSLVKRTANLDSLNLAFSPSNYQPSISFIVHYHFCTQQKVLNSSKSQIICEEIEEWVNDKNAGRKPTKDFSKTYAYTFLWNSSPINLFIRPDLLASLSLFTFRTHIFHTHIILDHLCENVINPTPQALISDPLDVCKEPTSILLLLESLTSDLKSFHLHKNSFFFNGIKNDGMEQGHPVYYFDPSVHKDDVCVLKQVDTYTKNRYILAVAILLTQILIPVIIPFSARIFFADIKYRVKRLYPASTHYFFGFIITTALLGLFALGSNIYLIASEELNDISRSSISDVRLYYIIGSVLMLVFVPLFALVNIWYNNARAQGRCCFKLSCFRCCCCRCNSCSDFFPVFSIFVLVFTANMISFNAIYVFMGLIAAPIQTGSLLLLYLAVFFLFTMFVALIHKGYKMVTRFRNPGSDFVLLPRPPLPPAPEFSNFQLEQPPDPLANQKHNEQQETITAENEQHENVRVENKQSKKTSKKIMLKKRLNCCVIVFDAFIVAFCALLFLADLLLYMVFYYEMAIHLEPYTSSAGFLSSFSILIPALFTLTAGILEKRFINFLSGFDMVEDRVTSTTPTSTREHTRARKKSADSITPLKETGDRCKHGPEKPQAIKSGANNHDTPLLPTTPQSNYGSIN